MMLREIGYRLKTKLGLKVFWVDHLIYLKPEELSDYGRKMQSILDDQIFEDAKRS